VVGAVGITSVLLFGAGIALVLIWYADVRQPRATAAGGIEIGLVQ
jgi:hypothetical protein